MNEAMDDADGFAPTELDLQRLNEIPIDGRVEAENGNWVVLRYPEKPCRLDWREWVLIINGGVPEFCMRDIFQLRSLNSVLWTLR